MRVVEEGGDATEEAAVLNPSLSKACKGPQEAAGVYLLVIGGPVQEGRGGGVGKQCSGACPRYAIQG
jgi:hypothetical protein